MFLLVATSAKESSVFAIGGTQNKRSIVLPKYDRQAVEANRRV